MWISPTPVLKTLQAYLVFICAFGFYMFIRVSKTLGLGGYFWYGCLVLAVEVLGATTTLIYGASLRPSTAPDSFVRSGLGSMGWQALPSTIRCCHPAPSYVQTVLSPLPGASAACRVIVSRDCACSTMACNRLSTDI